MGRVRTVSAVFDRTMVVYWSRRLDTLTRWFNLSCIDWIAPPVILLGGLWLSRTGPVKLQAKWRDRDPFIDGDASAKGPGG